MSKFYAIKLNNGNYHKHNSGSIVCFTNKQDTQHYMKYNHYDGEIVQVNIDIDKDQQIAELKAENEKLKKYETIYYLNQLQASNEDINKFKQNELHQCINISYLLKDNTKQVCEKIRKNIVKYVYGGNLFDIKGFKEFLDQVEKGE